MDNLPSLATDRGNLSLSEQVKLQLKTPEDCAQYGQKVVKGQTLLSWHLADLLKYTKDKFGINMAIEVGHELGYQPSSIKNYIKVAQAFSPEDRFDRLSFSHHFVASTVDDINRDTGEFETDRRFSVLEQALDEGLSVRDLKEKIYEEKKMEKLDVTVLPCQWCKRRDGEIITYTIFSIAQFPRRDPDKIELHPFCYEEIKDVINEHANN